MADVVSFVSAPDVYEVLRGKGEFALLDVREQEEFSRSHVLLACCVPLSRMELLVEQLVPCKSTVLFVMDGGGAEDMERGIRAARVLRGMGYTDVHVLDGGLKTWRESGFVTVNGVGALSKGFGEYVEMVQQTPRLAPIEVKTLLDDPASPAVVIDVRPAVEYHTMNIPGSVNLPGCEVTYRLAEVVKDAHTTIVINCAGRTRSIIGTQTLINAHIPNRVIALKGGTMNWQLAGLELEYNSERPVPKLTAHGHRIAEERIRKVGTAYGVRFVEPEQVADWQAEPSRNTYLFDVRQPEEYAAGHIPGAIAAQGGQLVQATDEYAAVRNGRYVLIDNDELRAIMTAHWLQQMGLPHVFVLRGGIAAATPMLAPRGLTVSSATTAAPGLPGSITPEEAARQMTEELLCLNVGFSNLHRVRHVPKAKWTTRAWLPHVHELFPQAGHILLTAEDSAHASLAARDAQILWPDAQINFVRGGTPAWEAAGLPLETGMPCALCAEDDVWYRPYTDIRASKESMQGYFDWESGLVDKIKADGCVAFHVKSY